MTFYLYPHGKKLPPVKKQLVFLWTRLSRRLSKAGLMGGKNTSRCLETFTKVMAQTLPMDRGRAIQYMVKSMGPYGAAPERVFKDVVEDWYSENLEMLVEMRLFFDPGSFKVEARPENQV